MCLRGASAIQTLLESRPDLDVRVFVIWEPVIVTDIAPPTSGTLARIPDARVAQFWDEGRVVSAEIVRSVRADPARYGLADELDDDTIVWDTVVLIPPAAAMGGRVSGARVLRVPGRHRHRRVDRGSQRARVRPQARRPGCDPSTP